MAILLFAWKPAVIAEDRESVRFARVCNARKPLLKLPILSAGCRAVERLGFELLRNDGVHTPAWGVALDQPTRQALAAPQATG